MTWKLHNLLAPLREEPFDCIFLKNVLIYFDTASKQAVVRNVLAAMAKGGYLVVGPTEGIYTMLDPLTKLKPWLYQKLAEPAELTQEEPAMSGFDLSELLPFYLDETDEHIAALNDALLRLEQDPTDAKALAEAFRMFHSIKGASVVMGFDPVNRLTHNLESLFDQFRSQEADAGPAGARPDLPLPGRAARLPPRPPRRRAKRRSTSRRSHRWSSRL